MEKVHLIQFTEILRKISKDGRECTAVSDNDITWYDVAGKRGCNSYVSDFILSVDYYTDGQTMVKEAILKILEENGVEDTPKFVIVEDDWF